MSELLAGTIVSLKVEREAPFGYFLTNGEEEVLLHTNDVTEEFDPDAEHEYEVFLYQDHQGRLAASLEIPKVQIDRYDWVEVVQVKRDLGVFVDIGLRKDILVSKDDLHELKELWPKEGDRLYCALKLDKRGRLFGKLATEDVIQTITVPANRKDFNKNVSGYVYRLLLVGSFILTEEGYKGFIHESQRNQEPRLGQKVTGRIIDVKEDGSVNVSLLGRGYEKMDVDSEAILKYLESRGGAMPYWDKSDPEDIQARFEMSKASFKRALGKLMKAGTIYQDAGWTYVKKEEQ